MELIGSLGLTPLAPDLAQLSRRPRGTDPHLLVEALTQLAARGAEVDDALGHLAARSGAAGQAAPK